MKIEQQKSKRKNKKKKKNKKNNKVDESIDSPLKYEEQKADGPCISFLSFN